MSVFPEKNIMSRGKLLAGLLALAGIAGCSSTEISHQPPPPGLFVRGHAAHATASSHAPHATATGFVERSLHAQGLRFGTDGSVGALYSYFKDRHRFVPAAEARLGDVVFFGIATDGQRCDMTADHVGLVDTVDASGRVTFREVRQGGLLHSYFDPTHPAQRRDDEGRILNSFLRPKRVADPQDTRYFAGQLVCAVGRVVMTASAP